MSDRNWSELNPPEKSRTYHYCGNEKPISFNNVTAIAVSKKGNHYLELKDGSKHIIAPGWKWIELNVEKWTI